ncbi:MAG: 1,4-dihydroxy-2-naphthoate octaprenyltransferase [Chlamydiia bacterium]|nr:1,4-dihydroxy-2-naphthoate octaprenyltransferase [Chlamydiia bacterium]MCH9618138.1 1,4-dihydroxy-2-naphthoate octaprenyltransferase [Chlamydiia bacterium]MCH9624018.1 1,4-dihydroxy-2-naphthoate octaprenyltransferase [Chlamydiia bacterium]
MTAKTLSEKSFFSLAIYGARPKTLVASFFPVILGMLLARFNGFYDIKIYLCTLFTAGFIQIGTNYANDFFDSNAGRDTKQRLGPPRLGSLNLVSKRTLSNLMIFSFVAAATLSIPLISTGGPIITYLMIAAVILGMVYSYGRYSLANTGLSNLIVFVVFGPLGTVMSYYLQTGLYETKAAFLGILPGCLSLMLFAMNNLRDYEEDKAHGKKTLVVRFGFAWGKKEYLTALFSAWIILPISMMIYHTPLITLLPLFLLPKGMRLAKKVRDAQTPLDIIPLFEETAKYNVLFALCYILGWRISTAM